MKKNMFALAAMAALAGTASAQSTVTVYGLVDAGLVQERGGAAGSATKLTSGVASGSRLGFKGTEDLGGGLSVLFLLENGLNVDTGTAGQGGLLFGRQAYVGMRGSFGSVLLGRQYTPEFGGLVMVDPFSTGLAGDIKNLAAVTGNSASRMDNAIKYISPTVEGVTGELVYAPGEVSGDSAAGRQLGGALSYAAGPLSMRLGYHNRNNDTATVKNTDNAKNALFSLTYDFAVAKAHFAYGTAKGLNSSPLRNTSNPFGYAVAPAASRDSQFLLLGATIPAGPGTFMASYMRKDDRGAANQDANQIAVGYRYALSKRSDLYTAYARISNKNGAGYTVGSCIESGTGDKALNLGMRHAF